MRRACRVFVLRVMQRAAEEGAKPVPKITPISARSASATTPSARHFSHVDQRLDQFPAEPGEIGMRRTRRRLLRPCHPPICRSPRRSSGRACPPRPAARTCAFAARGCRARRDILADIEADRIHQLDRPHRHAEGHRRRIEQFLALALLDPLHRAQHVGHQHAVDEEARRRLDHHRGLADGQREGAALPRRRPRGCWARGSPRPAAAAPPD